MSIPNPDRLVRAASRRARRAKRAVAARRHSAAVRLRPRDAEAWFRLGKVRERQADRDGAKEAYTTAATLAPDNARYHARLGRLAAARELWAEATAHYRRALELKPGEASWTRALGKSLMSSGEFAEAIDVIDKALAGAANRVPLLKPLAEATEATGQWDRASATLSELVESNPDSHKLRQRLASCLERQYSVPFTLGQDGTATFTPDSEEVYAQAVAQLTHLVEDAPSRPHAAYRLGLLAERHDDLPAAAEAYRTALRRLDEIDESWTHPVIHHWRFRLARVTQADPGDARIGRTAQPDTETIVPAAIENLGGFYETIITDQGLRIFGYLTPRTKGSVDMYIDGELLCSVTVDTTLPLHAFRFDIMHDVLARFGERSELTVSVRKDPLVTMHGATVTQLVVPGGTGELEPGISLTKRGQWRLTGAELAAKQQAYLRVYVRTKEILEQHFGKQLFLFYGTLLGCQRENGFIPGDDDFDAGYMADSTNPEDFKQELQETALALLGHGLDICFAINGRMLKTGIDDVWIDITPAWFYDGRAWAFETHDLDRGAFEPIRATTFVGHAAYVLHDTEAFLADNYGPNWRTPQSDFHYYHDKANRKILKRTWLTPSEVLEFTRRAEQVTAKNPSAGTFAGVGHPSWPGFR